MERLNCLNRVDAEIFKRVTKREPKNHQRDSMGRFGMLSAQTVRQDMGILKKIRQGRTNS